jgi:hypothetical protein
MLWQHWQCPPIMALGFSGDRHRVIQNVLIAVCVNDDRFHYFSSVLFNRDDKITQLFIKTYPTQPSHRRPTICIQID